MKITEDRGTIAKLKDLDEGTVIYLIGAYWIITDSATYTDTVDVVRLEDGYCTSFNLNAEVTKIDAELIIH